MAFPWALNTSLWVSAGWALSSQHHDIKTVSKELQLIKANGSWQGHSHCVPKPKHTTERAHLELTDRGSFWRDFCAPHSQLFAQTQVGGTKRKALEKPWGHYSSIWPQSLPPACFCWAVLKNEGDEDRPWEFRASGGQEKWTTALLWSVFVTFQQ